MKRLDPEFEYRTILRLAVKTWGEQAQVNMLHEEIGELMQAINKHRRKHNHKTYDALIEEIADVEIMLEQLKLMIGGNPEAGVIVHKYAKLKRLEERLEKVNTPQLKPTNNE